MNTFKPEAVEHLSNTLNRDFRNVRKAVLAEDLDKYTQTMLLRLHYTVEDTRKMLAELSRQLSEKN